MLALSALLLLCRVAPPWLPPMCVPSALLHATPLTLPTFTCLPPRPPALPGEWFEAKPEPGEHVEPLDEQRAEVVASLWKTVGIYAGVGVVSGIAVCLHKVRGNL